MSITKIATVTVGAGGASSIDFTSIPQGFSDLMVVYSTRPGSTDGSWIQRLRFNGVATNQTFRGLDGTGSATESYTSTEIALINEASGATANTFSNGQVYIPNYAGSTYKSVSVDGVSENNATQAFSRLAAGLWSSTAAITQVSLIAPSTYAQYTTATLYGITSLAKSAKATGGQITSDANYIYHTFTASGTFTPTVALTADVLVVAGGGGSGGNSYGAGGGAGGLQYFSAQSIAASAQTVTVGAGGAGGAVGSGNGANGSNSVFGALTASVGGGGGGINGNNGAAGGSGGGGAITNRTGGAGTSGQGFAGGSGTTNSSGGGGGAGGVGANGSGSGALGGPGVGTYTAMAQATGTGVLYSGTYYYAGGGAGVYTGGVSPTPVSGSTAAYTAGKANSGQGGGGENTAGGSGVVIIRYPK